VPRAQKKKGKKALLAAMDAVADDAPPAALAPPTATDYASRALAAAKASASDNAFPTLPVHVSHPPPRSQNDRKPKTPGVLDLSDCSPEFWARMRKLQEGTAQT